MREEFDGEKDLMQRWGKWKERLNWILKMHSSSSGLSGDICYKQKK